MRLVVTGGLGFIGKHFIKYALGQGCRVVNIDAQTYAADLSCRNLTKYLHCDINRLPVLPAHDVVVNFAAESHVDGSIVDASVFVDTNVSGVLRLLQLKPKRLIQISTDEVYGPGGPFDESAKLNPQNPYAATKASADLLIQAHSNTHGLDYNLIRPTNNYGFGQYPEKLIPRTIKRLRNGLKAEVHGDGSYQRMWLHVEDTAKAVWTVIEKGASGEAYNIAGVTKSNLSIIQTLCDLAGGEYEFVANRPGQDVRYAVDDSKLIKLGWSPDKHFSLEEIHARDGVLFGSEPSRMAAS